VFVCIQQTDIFGSIQLYYQLLQIAIIFSIIFTDTQVVFYRKLWDLYDEITGNEK
jgi:hypothetical protein